MFWHYLREAVAVLVVVHGFHGLLNFRHSAKAGEFRRIWNWPMRAAVLFWLAAGVFGCIGAWIGKQPGGSAVGSSLVSVTIFAIIAGMVSLLVFLIGFLGLIMCELRPKKSPAPVEDNINKVQTLLLRGEKQEAILLYQMQNQVTPQETEEAIEAVGAALQDGLRV